MKNIDIDKIDKVIMDDIKDMKNRVSDHIQSDMISNAPVDSGALRGNIRVFLNEGMGKFNPDFKDASGTITKTLNREEINRAELFDDIRISSLAPYSIKIEFEGHSGQSPSGFVRRSLQTMEDVL